MTGGYPKVWEMVGLLNVELWNHGSAENKPHHQAAPQGIGVLGQPSEGEGVNNGQVALDADAHERVDGAVDTSIEAGRHHMAQSRPKHPVVSVEMIEHSQGQSKQEREVR